MLKVQEMVLQLIAKQAVLLETLEEASTGLLWYMDRNPGQSDGSDDEALARIGAVLGTKT